MHACPFPEIAARPGTPEKRRRGNDGTTAPCRTHSPQICRYACRFLGLSGEDFFYSGFLEFDDESCCRVGVHGAAATVKKTPEGNFVMASGEIPRRIHHVWIQGRKSLRADETRRGRVDAIQRLNPGWSYTVWEEQSIRRLLASIGEEYLELYDRVTRLPDTPGHRINPLASKSDIARLAVSYVWGGCYMDIDVGCIGPLDDITARLPPLDGRVAMPALFDMYGSQFILAAPRCSMLRSVLDRATQCADRWQLGLLLDKTARRHPSLVYRIPDDLVSTMRLRETFVCRVPAAAESSQQKLSPRSLLTWYNDHYLEAGGALAILVLLLLGAILMLSIARKHSNNHQEIAPSRSGQRASTS